MAKLLIDRNLELIEFPTAPIMCRFSTFLTDISNLTSVFPQKDVMSFEATNHNVPTTIWRVPTDRPAIQELGDFCQELAVHLGWQDVSELSVTSKLPAQLHHERNAHCLMFLDDRPRCTRPDVMEAM
jgi:hypothetical protein